MPLKSFPKGLTWQDLGRFARGRDYDCELCLQRNEKKGGEVTTYLHLFILKGFYLLEYEGLYIKDWNDGKLTSKKIYFLPELHSYPDFETVEVRKMFSKSHRVSKVWFHKRRRKLSNFFKILTEKEYDDLDGERFPGLIGFRRGETGSLEIYREDGGSDSTRELGIPVPPANSHDWPDFTSLMNFIGRRLLLAEDFRDATTGLAFDEHGLHERWAGVFEEPTL